ncbi:peptide/nickel transport system substrate-binding protein [Loktanella sp. DSM 29012]|uniref:Peptide ABC transporter substrate-binding protein n=1 Tax=Loktanella gaetbuli TaxID=2881335 RepID=A0ABS8BR22_9RHOB|nr:MULTISPECIES: peptide ABC transporter substrate-binding protein [Loktanella]MCB5198189.1 peptide ABC transporter substrate-binding protein [Loktanella gaetbuli]SEQ28550.1 peptide/nickel transport system substrate-binding protein [Loktanella sp. DSM 29012]
MKMKTILLGAIATMGTAPMVHADAHEGDRGRDGQVNIIYWQAPSIMNPFLSGGTKDVEAASLVLEPLMRFNETGEIVPWLVDEVPTVENGGVAEDLTSITYKITEGITWSDGTPFTSADVAFTYEYCTAEGGGCAQATKFDGITSVETPDDLTVIVNFSSATPYPYSAFNGAESPIIQAAQFADCLGPKAPECTDQNFMPIGTGPFVVTDFRTNDVIQFEANPNYRDANKPAFQTVTLKGGGDATAAGRAVMETGEFDYAWNLQLAPDVIAQMQEGGQGVPVAGFGTLVERIMLNNTNPDPSLSDAERSVIRPHPFLGDPAVFNALSMAIDRPLLVEVGYGQAGRVTCNWVPAPDLYASDSMTCDTQDIEGAKAMLEEAGYVDTDGDGVRETPDGVPMAMLFQSSTNAVRQDFQALIKDWWEQIGLSVELRNIDSSVFFGGDPGSPDTFQKFMADVQMYANNFPGTDPQAYLGNGKCDAAPTPDTQWQGENISRFCMEEYDALHAELTQTADLNERGRIARELNDMAVQNGMMIPLVDRGRLSAHANSLGGVVLNTWDSELWNVADWYRTGDNR